MTRARGFTLIELMIVVLIIGILAAVAIPNFSIMLARSKEAAVKSNSHTVQIAAEDFAVQNEGVYAADIDGDRTMNNKTITDILPNGRLLENPFSRARSEPVNGAASDPGEIGYEPVEENGVAIGYRITAIGKAPNTTILALISGQ